MTTIRHTYPVGLLSNSDELFAEAYTTGKHKRLTSMTSGGYEPEIPTIRPTP